jgi:AraC-like DNA-binding protein
MTAPSRSSTPPPAFSRLLLDTGMVRIGRFRIGVDDPAFEEAGQPQRHLFVFPRTSVWIEHPGQEPFVADPTVVTYYNRLDLYRRRPLSEHGDRCEWFAVAPEVLREIVACFDPAVEARPERPFPFTHGPSDAGSYLLQRAVVRHLVEEAPEPDPLFVEETTLRVLARVLGQAFARRGAEPAGPPSLRHARAAAFRLKAFAAGRLDQRLTLERLGGELASSPFHLCRQFKTATGLSVHAFLTQLRLRTALERVAEPGSDLTEVALDCGFSSHSHFTTAFRTAFGLAPSALRGRASSRKLRELGRRVPGWDGS